ncbi:DUF6580 family putative transport protein [Pedobacter metabolipauper]|uniref:Uncharacterized protein n=1 Tax=Pedobacter metabolipauper TaxID=425513 RepID=A0A4R6T3V7_9SPHI|nr:DUF6580 family putative transport protein [Pedobacter metabolipauper]TDQ12061.1 hypothetical protein ATK78_1192 [Pedobacter metabolipauper]
MSESKFNQRTAILLLIVLLITVLRTVAPFSDNFKDIANFSAVGAITLFSGAYFKNAFKSFGIPLATLLITDLILSLTIYKEYSTGFLYEGWYWTYLAFALMVLAGRLIVKKVNVLNFVLGTFAVVLIHWIVTDFGVWLGSSMYPQTLSGFWLCLYSAIPFELRFVYGTIAYGILMFGSFELLKVKYPYLSLAKERAI